MIWEKKNFQNFQISLSLFLISFNWEIFVPLVPCECVRSQVFNISIQFIFIAITINLLLLLLSIIIIIILVISWDWKIIQARSWRRRWRRRSSVTLWNNLVINIVSSFFFSSISKNFSIYLNLCTIIIVIVVIILQTITLNQLSLPNINLWFRLLSATAATTASASVSSAQHTIIKSVS